MRAIGLFTHGGPEVLQVVELPEVHAGRGQVRIRVHAATVNPTDVGVRSLAAPSRIPLAGLLMSSDHSLTFSIQVMRNENFGLALQETSRDGPAENPSRSRNG